ELADAPLPEAECLGVRVIDAEDAHAHVAPEQEDTPQLVPQRLPVLRLEVDRIDVLVFLGRVLCILDGAIRPLAEPFGMGLHPGMVRRALEGDVDGDLDVVIVGAGEEMLEIVESAEVGVKGLVSSFRRADTPRTADVAGLSGHRIVLALAKLSADG